MEMPSQEEQLIAEQYVLDRPIERPDTDAKKAVKYVLMFALLSLALSLAVNHLFDRLGIFSYFPDFLLRLREARPGLFEFLFILCIVAICGLISLRMIVIGCIRLYQHYAPEEIRRRCLFKPTCSEYAILAVKKYGVVIGLIKAYFRLVKRCRGNIYSIDYP